MAIFAKDASNENTPVHTSHKSVQRGDSVQAKEGNLLSKYMVISKKGEGTFSEVLECRNRNTDESVAVKKLKQRYDSMYQCNKIREVQAMRKLSGHANIVKLREMIYEPTSCTLYLVLELMDMNLYELIRAIMKENKKSGKRNYLPESRIRFYMLQLVDAVRHMHKHGIFHRDVKPENILVKGDLLKLADFGSCRSRESKQPFTEYISTRWYRAPECLLTDGYYDYKMDVWSVGCVYFEISTLKPLFPGQNEIDQIDKIHKLFGTPPSEVLSKFKRSRSMSFNFPPSVRDERTLTHLVEPMPSDGVDLLYKMLEYDPAKRITMEECLQHIYLRALSEQLKSQREAKRQQQAAAAASNAGVSENDKINSNSTDKIGLQNAPAAAGDKKDSHRSNVAQIKSLFPRGSFNEIYRNSSLVKKTTRNRSELQPFIGSKYASSNIAGNYQQNNKGKLSHSFLSHSFHSPLQAPPFSTKQAGTIAAAPSIISGSQGAGASGYQLPYLVNQNSNNYHVSYQRYQSDLKKKTTLPHSNLPKIEG